MAGRACARLRLPPALATAIDSGRSDLSVTFDNDGIIIKLWRRRVCLSSGAGQRRRCPNCMSIPRRLDGPAVSQKIGSSPPPVLYDTSPPWRPRPKDRATTKARTVDAATKAKSRRRSVLESAPAPPAQRRAVAKKKTKKAPRSRPVLCTEEDVEDSDTEAPLLFACTDATRRASSRCSRTSRRSGSSLQKDSFDVYVIFGTSGGFAGRRE